MNIIRNFLIILFFLTIQNVYPGEKFLIEGSFGFPSTTVSEDASPSKFKELYYIYDINPLLQSPNNERVALGLLKSSVFRESKIQNINSRLGFEYRLFPFFGLGASYNQSSVTVTDVLPGDYLILYSLGLPPEAPKNTPPDASNFFSLSSRELRSTITTAEAEFNFHFIPNSKTFDPYFRFGYGTALSGVFGSSQKFTYTGGLRYRFRERWSISTEFFKGDLYGNLGRTDFAVEKGIRLGFGVYF